MKMKKRIGSLTKNVVITTKSSSIGEPVKLLTNLSTFFFSIGLKYLAVIYKFNQFKEKK